MELDTLKGYGNAYQSKIIAALLTDKVFFEQIDDILFVEYFESEGNKWIVEKIKKYFNKYKEIPTLEVFKREIDEEINEVLKIDVTQKLRSSWEHTTDTDLNYIKDKFLSFCKNQKLKSAIYSSVDLLKSENYDEIHRLFDDALKAGLSKNIGVKLMEEEVETIFKKLQRFPISTPWDKINEISQGGLSKKELGIIVAPPGTGKTWVLTSIGSEALKQNKTVIHYTLELPEGMIAQRYYSSLTHIYSENLEYSVDEISRKVESLANKGSKLIIKEYPTKGASINTLRAHIEKTKTNGYIPDLIIVDYGDLLKPPHFYKEKRLQIGNIFEDLRGLAGEFEIPIWTATQSNRSSQESNEVRGEQVSEDYSKIFIGDFIFSIQRKVEDKVSKTARIHIIKNRFGPDGFTYPSTFDAGNGLLSIHEPTSEEGKSAKKKMGQSGDILRKILHDKYVDIQTQRKEQK